MAAIIGTETEVTDGAASEGLLSASAEAQPGHGDAEADAVCEPLSAGSGGELGKGAVLLGEADKEADRDADADCVADNRRTKEMVGAELGVEVGLMMDPLLDDVWEGVGLSLGGNGLVGACEGVEVALADA